jgi:signal transduction histidine kinase
MIFGNTSIRTKIILAQILLIALVSAFIYTYYPDKQKESATEAIRSKIQSISNMFSIGVGIGMGEMDLVAISEAVNWANSDSSVIYISVVDPAGQEITSYNNENREVPAEINMGSSLEKDRVIYSKSSIVYQNKQLGSLVIGYSLRKLDEDIMALKKTTLIFSLALFAVGAILSVILGNMISGNIRKLDNAITAISSGSESIRVNIQTNDEIGKLSRAFNEMIDKQEHAHKELVSYSEQLKKQNEELNQFSYVVSHDLKAPLRAIFKLSQWIEEDLGEALPPETKKNMAILRGRVFRLEALINGLLEYSKIGRDKIADENTDVQSLLKEIIDLLNPPENFVIQLPRRMPVFKTKKIMLQQVFINLLSNALKYNDKAEGLCSISVEQEGSYYKFMVTDNGVGIDKAFHKKIFGIFQTLNSRDQVEGTGIGLSIVKKCVEDMGGSVSVESSVGAGSTFAFTWPKEPKGSLKRKIQSAIKQLEYDQSH